MPDSKPNIIFCHVDQMHIGAFSRLGNAHVSTPGLDEMAADALSFTRAISSNPICSPARGCWYTGRMSSEHGIFFNGGGLQCRPDIPDLGQLLKPAGYDCYYGGKWHVEGRDPAKSFQILYPIISLGERNDEALASVGEAFFESYKGDRPFFLNLGFMNPHDCCLLDMDTDANAFKIGMEKLVAAKELPPLPPNHDPRKPMPIGGKHWNEEQLRLYLYTYYRMCEAVDASVSRVYRAFKKSRFFENSVFIWGSDHGEMMAEHNLFGKSVPWDASQRVPLMVVHKNHIAPGTVNDTHWIQGVDVSATIVDYAGADPIPNASIARSFKPLLENQPTEWHDYVVSESSVPNPIVSFRKDNTKSVFHLQGNEVNSKRVELYDIATDPWEMKDLAANGANPPGLDEHRAFLKDYQSRVAYLPAYRAGVAAGHLTSSL